jgi:tetratricopeptide (TPR) repeat protein
MWPQRFTAAVERLSLRHREVCSATNQASASAHHPTPGGLDLARLSNDLGQHTDVLEDYQKSLALRHRLVCADPTNAQWRYDEACFLDQIGYEYRKAGLNQEAVGVYEVSATIWRQLAKTDPWNRQLDLSISLGKLGDARLAVADRAGAISAYEESAVTWRRLLKRDPESAFLRINLAECLEKVGDLKFKAGDNTGALTAYEDVLALYWRLDEIEGSNAQRQWNLSFSWDRMGDIELALGHTIAAASAYEQSLALRRGLVEADTCNSRWQDGVSSSLQKISDLERVARERAAKLAVQRDLQDIDRLMFEIDRVSAELQERLSLSANEGNAATSVPTRVLATVEESLTVSRQLAASNPTNAKHQYDLLADLEELARARIHNGDPVEAFSAYEEGLAIRRCLADTDQNDEQLQRGLCVTLEKFADVRHAERDQAAAIALYEESLSRRRRFVAQNNGDTPDAPDAALSLVPSPCTDPKKSGDEGRRCATAQGRLDIVFTLKKLANARLKACDNSGARAALEESLALARQLLEENKTSYINAALHGLTRSLANMSGLLALQFERSRNETSALLAKVSAKAWVAHKSRRTVITVRLLTDRLLPQYRREASALLDKISATTVVATQVSQRAAKVVRLGIRQLSRRYRSELPALLNQISAGARQASHSSQRAAKKLKLAIRHQLRRYRQGASALADKILARA